MHLHSRIGADLWGGVAARLTGVPVVHTRRVDNLEPRWLMALKYRLHDRVIAVSEGIGRILLTEALPPGKMRVVRSAVDWRRFAGPCSQAEVTAGLGVPADALLVGVVAQLIPRKGHRFLLDALPPLVLGYPGLRILVFGQGPEEEALRRRILEAGLGDRVLRVGFRSDLDRILPCLDLLVHPATIEGLGVSLLQAASAAVPIPGDPDWGYPRGGTGRGEWSSGPAGGCPGAGRDPGNSAWGCGPAPPLDRRVWCSPWAG